MLFTINDCHFWSRREICNFKTLKRKIEKELERNLALKLESTNSTDPLMFLGEGSSLSVLIETMRREGYELQVGQPQVIIKEINGVKHEPVEELTIDIPETHSENNEVEAIKRRNVKHGS